MAPLPVLPVPESALEWAKELLEDAQKRRELCHREFEAADADGSGSLDTDEVKDLIFRLCGAMGIRMPKEERVLELVRKVDKDNSGELDVKEFATAFKCVIHSCVHEAEVEAAERAAQAKKEAEEIEKKLEEHPKDLEEVLEEALEIAEEKLHTEDAQEKAELQKELVTDLMIAEKLEGGLDHHLRERVNTRAYFLWLNGSSKSTEQNYFDALRTELELMLADSTETFPEKEA
eukprot:TRINITY_DN84281_c0_g1_i1.p1 TRINITY_DN84281_c0_g1~~TRINITY_DN84281_c0_g1_i1.p1  ORF type:complete len:233 (+),score=88.53 TRINITY_DN84281_c0_g1_i1:82-780(+)